MKDEELIQRISLNSAIFFGKPTVRNMRYPTDIQASFAFQRLFA